MEASSNVAVVACLHNFVQIDTGVSFQRKRSALRHTVYGGNASRPARIILSSFIQLQQRLFELDCTILWNPLLLL
jgi:hypothetical protein